MDVMPRLCSEMSTRVAILRWINHAGEENSPTKVCMK